jgi:hypothetical protein
MVFLCDEPSGCPLTRRPALAWCAGGEDDQTDGELLQDTHKGVNRKTGVRLSRLDYRCPHQPLEQDNGGGGLVPEAAAAFGEPPASVLRQQVLGDLVDGSLPLDDGWVSLDPVVTRLHGALLGTQAYRNTRLVARILVGVKADDVLGEGERLLLPLVNKDGVLPLH